MLLLSCLDCDGRCDSLRWRILVRVAVPFVVTPLTPKLGDAETEGGRLEPREGEEDNVKDGTPLTVVWRECWGGRRILGPVETGRTEIAVAMAEDKPQPIQGSKRTEPYICSVCPISSQCRRTLALPHYDIGLIEEHGDCDSFEIPSKALELICLVPIEDRISKSR